jgi:drug/metabolite transporter (DMT)-like permease
VAEIVRLFYTKGAFKGQPRSRLARFVRAPAALRSLPEGLPVTIRRAAPGDLPAIAALAEIDEAPVPTGDLLVAEVGGELWAAASLHRDQGISDPFRPSGELLQALAERAGRRRRPAPEHRERLSSGGAPEPRLRLGGSSHPPLVRARPRAASADPAAERDVGVRPQEDDPQLRVQRSEHEHLGDERTDLSGPEVDGCHDESAVQLGGRVVGDLRGRAPRPELGTEVDRQLPGRLARLGEGVDRDHPADAHLDTGEVVELDHGRANIAGRHAVPAVPTVAPAWLAWLALITVYVVWGSTYLAIRVMVAQVGDGAQQSLSHHSVPALLGAGARFLVAGLALYAWIWLRRGRGRPAAGPADPLAARAERPLRVSRREAAAAAGVGILLAFGGNGLVTVAETQIASSLAALVIASVPLVIVVLGAILGERVSRRALLGVTVGFVGVTILVLPGAKAGGSGLVGALLVLAASVSWGAGSICSTRLRLPADIGVSTALQMTAGGGVMLVAGLVAGEADHVDLTAFSTRSIVAFAYLVVFGSIVAFSAYAWLLQHVPISRVSTYAYVNPMIAVLLGWAVLGESISPTMLLGATVIVGSVAFIVSSTRPAVPPERKGAPDRSMVATARRRV